MNRQLIRKILHTLSVLLFGAMTATTAYNYAAMECAIAHQGASAPASVALLSAVPFAAGIVICLIVSIAIKER